MKIIETCIIQDEENDAILRFEDLQENMVIVRLNGIEIFRISSENLKETIKEVNEEISK